METQTYVVIFESRNADGIQDGTYHMHVDDAYDERDAERAFARVSEFDPSFYILRIIPVEDTSQDDAHTRCAGRVNADTGEYFPPGSIPLWMDGIDPIDDPVLYVWTIVTTDVDPTLN